MLCDSTHNRDMYHWKFNILLLLMIFKWLLVALDIFNILSMLRKSAVACFFEYVNYILYLWNSMGEVCSKRNKEQVDSQTYRSRPEAQYSLAGSVPIPHMFSLRLHRDIKIIGTQKCAWPESPHGYTCQISHLFPHRS